MEEQQICRICMRSYMLLDWNNLLFPLSDSKISYKDCYYKYTQIEVKDTLPQFLCKQCSTDLKNVHLFIEKALEAEQIFQQSIQQFENEHLPLGIEDIKIEHSFIKGQNQEDNADEKLKNGSVEEITADYADDINEFELIEEDDVHIEDTQCLGNEEQEEQTDIIIEDNSGEDEENETDIEKDLVECDKDPIGEEGAADNNYESETNGNNDKVTKPKKRIYTPAMCSYCSKILRDVHYLKRHEQTHKECRERIVECPKCGFKTYNNRTLRMHMECHDENREKKYKCEFCDKSFFHRGSCNVHRRIHLGKTVKCSICSKEFPRQVDLDVHMKCHSNTPIYFKPKSRFIVHCKYCGKDINGRMYYEHRAKHLNQPLIRCTLCEKDFFSRQTCSLHMTRTHKRTKGNYDDIAMYYEKYRMRLSHKFILQQEKVTPKTE
ncbi:zinc finger protein 30 [Musca domestica]|uniref:Zinc finger protein 30 n=1 Tax=Musca domestica TaxID=7370 RepID=A0A9J7I5U9_MUSDO|nr:zinc finger protein 30 [Musca domestica]